MAASRTACFEKMRIASFNKFLYFAENYNVRDMSNCITVPVLSHTPSLHVELILSAFCGQCEDCRGLHFNTELINV